MSEMKRDWQPLIYPQNSATAPPSHGHVVGLKRVPVDRDWAFTPDDARLIAAAPDLLAACEAQGLVFGHAVNCERCCDGGLCPTGFGLDSHAEELRAAAVAKAKGETP